MEHTHPLRFLGAGLLAAGLLACSEPGSGTGAPVDIVASGGDADATVIEDTGPAADTAGCQCPADQHCNAAGECEDDVCVKGSSSCASKTSVKVCAEDGSSEQTMDCPDQQVCDIGECVEPVCEPNAEGGCQDGQVLICNSLGTAYYPVPCPAGQGCVGAGCQPILPNVLLLVDTSSSMNWSPGGTKPGDCSGSCPPWSYPSCDDAADPWTRLGRVKHALAALLASDSAADVRIALQRFPQRPYTALPPDCDGGYWTGESKLTGDEDFHALSKVWLAQRLPMIVLEPFPTSGDTDLAALGQWFDFQEAFADTSQTCAENEDCDYTPCLGGHCQVYTDPELWGMGLTPFGKSLFYAGEYMRHFVLVEGKACSTDADCESANYVCEAGSCHDPFRDCRPNVIIAFTDGEETEHSFTDDFFHPRVQAKRLHYGLACESDADCGASASCTDNICRPPPGEVDEAQLVCDSNDVPCTVDDDCKLFECHPAQLDFADPTGADHLEDAAGNFLSFTIHVVDASNVPDANNLVAEYGGGQHFSVDLDDPETLYATFQTLFGDAKNAVLCGQ